MRKLGGSPSFSSDEWARLVNLTDELTVAVRGTIQGKARRTIPASDIVHQVLQYAYEHPHQWKEIPADNLIFYLRRISRYFISNKLRELRIHREVLVGTQTAHADEMEEKKSQRISPVKDIHKVEKKKAVEKILTRLKHPTHREVLRLVWLQEMPVKQAAKKMGCTTLAAYGLLKRAMASCRSIARRASFDGFRVSGETV